MVPVSWTPLFAGKLLSLKDIEQFKSKTNSVSSWIGSVGCIMSNITSMDNIVATVQVTQRVNSTLREIKPLLAVGGRIQSKIANGRRSVQWQIASANDELETVRQSHHARAGLWNQNVDEAQRKWSSTEERLKGFASTQAAIEEFSTYMDDQMQKWQRLETDLKNIDRTWKSALPQATQTEPEGRLDKAWSWCYENVIQSYARNVTKLPSEDYPDKLWSWYDKNVVQSDARSPELAFPALILTPQYFERMWKEMGCECQQNGDEDSGIAFD
ncbi:MAG: hypothetical protein Q9220_007519 [cf. Caloplaca sp. 1 TL-2023]